MRVTGTAGAKVFDGLTGVLLAPQQQGARAGRGTLGELIQGQSLTAGLDDAGTGDLAELQGGDGHLGDLQEALIVGHSSDQDGDGTLGLAVQLLGNGRQRHGGTVDLAHAQALRDGLVETRLGAAGQEAIQARQQAHVWVVGGGLVAVLVANVMLFNIDTL